MRLALLVLVAACGGGSATSPTPTPITPPADDGPVIGPPQVAWKDLTKEQRARFMDKVVTPKMKELFVAFDAKEFAEFGCKTCHGDGADDKSFKMPNAGLYEIPMTEDGFAALAKDKPEYVKFMATEVKPTMAELLGLEEFDPKNPKPGTLGCLSCHAAEAPKTATP